MPPALPSEVINSAPVVQASTGTSTLNTVAKQINPINAISESAKNADGNITITISKRKLLKYGAILFLIVIVLYFVFKKRKSTNISSPAVVAESTYVCPKMVPTN